MRKFEFPLLAGVALASSAMAVEPDAPEAFQTDGQWRLSSLEDGCSVARDFVRGDERVTLSIKRIHPRSAVQFAVIGAPILEGSGSLEAGFLPSEKLHRFDRVAAASIGERDGVVFAGRLFPEPEEGEERLVASEVTDFVIVDPRGTKTTLHTRAIDQAISALDSCVTERLKDFGLDLEAHSKLDKHVTLLDVGKLAEAIQRGYPKEAVRKGWDGMVPLRLIIDGNGRVIHCHVTNFLTAKILRDAACDAMKEHARFDPAKDAEGNPATDFAFQQVRYLTAGGQRPFSADAHGFAIRHD
ncbi:MAG: hypothetical protein HKO08_00050 [Erythrobacter sp.]|nr:hypothetical protein [Erythrobacter sp.]